MQDTSEEALLLAISNRDDVFDMFREMFSSKNYLRVLMAFEEGMSYEEISNAAEVSEGTVSNAFKELEKFGLIGQGEGGRYQTMPVLRHPMIQYYYWNEVVGNE